MVCQTLPCIWRMGLWGRVMNHLNKDKWQEFWSLVKHSNSNDCWNWTGGCNSDGYGYFKQQRAHRLAYWAEYGFLIHFVLQRCNNRLCYNPQHLYDGTHAQNMIDMTIAGNHDGKNRRGEKHPLSKLTNEQANYIRSSTNKGVDLAREFNVSQALISSIRNRTRRNCNESSNHS